MCFTQGNIANITAEKITNNIQIPCDVTITLTITLQKVHSSFTSFVKEISSYQTSEQQEVTCTL